MNEARIIKMNTLAEKYIQNRRDEDFEELYAEFHDEYKHKYASLATYYVKSGDKHQVESEYKFLLFACLLDYNPGTNFVSLLLTTLKNRKINMADKQRTITKHSHKPKRDKAGEYRDPIPEIKSAALTEQIVIDKITKKSHTQKKELIDYLKENNADPTTEMILNEIPKHDTLNGAAKALGMQHIQLTRKLKKLRKLYDPALFGDDYMDYLTD